MDMSEATSQDAVASDAQPVFAPWALDAAQEIMDRCDKLAEFSDMEGGIERTYLSPEMDQVYTLVGEWMRSAGLTVHRDPAGNLIGHVEGRTPGLPALILGSHLDTVPDAGKYDGILGVITGLAVAKQLIASGEAAKLPFSLDVVAFGDEEGVRYGATLLGSYALAGKWKDEWLQLRDKNGMSMSEAFTSFGLDPSKVRDAAYTREQAVGYLEFHIEQGPILEQRDRALSSVSSIAAASRYVVSVDGESRHIATPYDLRKDALTSAAEMIEAIDRISQAAGTRANVGGLSTLPGGVNVIASNATFTLDLRAGTNELRDEVYGRIWQAFDEVAAKRGVSYSKRCIHTADAMICDEFLRGCIEQGIVEAEQKEAFGLISYPGHDGMAVGELLPIAMLYVRCKGGISHNPGESVRLDDVAYGADAFSRAVLAVARAQEAKE
jgi:allantoate deiminase